MAVPILISVYDRDKHFKITVQSLRANSLASETDLYVAIDFSDDYGVVKSQKKIRQYLLELSGFNSVNLIEREVNFGAYKNITDAIDYLLKDHDCIILTEDDNYFSPCFLEYMNTNIELHRNDSDIYSICSYLEPISTSQNESIHCFSRSGFTSYGFCLWRDKYYAYVNSSFDIKNEKRGLINYFMLLKNLNYNVLSGLVYSAEKNELLSDYDMIYYMSKNNLKCIFPSKTLVRNIGQDGSGINSGVNQSLMEQEIFLTGRINFNLNVKISKKMNGFISKYHRRDVFRVLYYYFRFFRL